MYPMRLPSTSASYRFKDLLGLHSTEPEQGVSQSYSLLQNWVYILNRLGEKTWFIFQTQILVSWTEVGYTRPFELISNPDSSNSASKFSGRDSSTPCSLDQRRDAPLFQPSFCRPQRVGRSVNEEGTTYLKRAFSIQSSI